MIMMIYLKNARRGGSSADFLNDVDFLHLVPGILKSQKNNSRAIFFELCDNAFEVVTKSVHELFKQITELSCTLDKVTVQHRSFTVLLTFFFLNGAIFCLLNSLLKMKEDDYDAQGTASMVVSCLKESLGMTRTQLATRLLHFRCVCSNLDNNFTFHQFTYFSLCSYDGVYASQDQRVSGGGCLNLPAMVGEQLGLEEGSLTGTWDYAHNLQIVWKNLLAAHPVVE